MTTRINIDISGALAGLQNAAEKLAQFRVALVQWAQVGMQRLILPRLKEATPVRTGQLRRARRFRRITNGGAFYWDRSGFYWRFQPGLEESHIKIIQDAIPDLVNWAVANARRGVGI